MAGRRQNAGFARTDRISEQVRRELAEILRFGIKDPYLSPLLPLLTVTDVEVSNDYSHAKVFYTTLSPKPEDAAALAQGLARLAGFLRRELGKRIRIHQIPQLHFHYDASIERGTRMSKLIDDAVRDLPPADEAEN